MKIEWEQIAVGMSVDIWERNSEGEEIHVARGIVVSKELGRWVTLTTALAPWSSIRYQLDGYLTAHTLAQKI